MSSIVSENQQENINDLINLITKEGDKIPIKKEVAKWSKLLETMITTDDDEDEENEQDIPVANINTKTLKLVIDFMEYRHKNGSMNEIEKPLSGHLGTIVSEWDYEFISKLDQETLFEVILGANYLNVQELLDLSCAQVASMIKGKTPEEIRQTFNIVNDFTPEEEAQVREENKWCEDA